MANQTAARVLFDVGRRIASLRESHGHTQETFSELLRVSSKYFQRVEAGRENLSIKSLVRIANAFNIEVAELFVVHRPTMMGEQQPH